MRANRARRVSRSEEEAAAAEEDEEEEVEEIEELSDDDSDDDDDEEMRESLESREEDRLGSCREPEPSSQFAWAASSYGVVECALLMDGSRARNVLTLTSRRERVHEMLSARRRGRGVVHVVEEES